MSTPDQTPKGTILVAEDDPTICRVLELGLTQAGYTVLTAPDGAAALESARAENPDLIILDIMMPRMDGNEVTRRLREDEAFRNIPILMLTARNQPRDREEAKASGADGFVNKPFEFPQLLPRIRELLEGQK